jgi:hypothetical protein
LLLELIFSGVGFAQVSDVELKRVVSRGLDWLAANQTRRGSRQWQESHCSLLAEGSTTQGGKEWKE